MMKKYDKYIDTKDIWLGQVPFNWEVSSLKYFVEIINGYAFKSDDYSNDMGVPIIRIGDISSSINASNAQLVNPKNLKELDRFIIKNGDLLLAMTGATIGKNCMYLTDDIAYVNQRVGILRSKNLLIQPFLKFFIDTPFFREFISLKCSGSAQENISSSQIAELKICLPSIEEQNHIARFLDHQTTIIDEIIQRKEKQIELLKEKRQSIINEMVTKGLNPNAKMKDSGIEWLGEIPEEWQIIPIRYLNTKVGSGVTPKGGGEVYTEEGVIFVRSQNVHFDGLRLDDVVKIDFETHEKMNGSKVDYKDVLLNITGASIGRCCVVNMKDEMNVNQHVCIIRPNKKILPEFLNLILQSIVGQIQIRLGITGGNREGLNFEAIKNFLIPVPDIISQGEIVRDIELKLASFEILLSKNSQQIEKLKEYRQSLISEAVTGKIDVRDWQPPSIN
jgi:type I restriction enzyme S subunit